MAPLGSLIQSARLPTQRGDGYPTASAVLGLDRLEEEVAQVLLFRALSLSRAASGAGSPRIDGVAHV